MALARPERTEMRDKVTALFAGVNMEDPLWKRVADAFEWNGVWPVVDGDHDLTGEVVEPSGEHFTVYPSWDAVIHRDVAKAAGWEIDREEWCARPPKKGGE